jgi:FKBP12-rapamycin complex-associated protein
VIPLSTNSGLIGWVPHCDTLHSLIRDYRDKKKILLNIEHRIMLRVRFVIAVDSLNSCVT